MNDNKQNQSNINGIEGPCREKRKTIYDGIRITSRGTDIVIAITSVLLILTLIIALCRA